MQQTTSASPRFRPPPPRLKPPSSSYRTEAQRQLQKTAQPFRLTARQRADALLAINDFHINVFLERRRCLPAYRTISKAKKAAIEGCFGLLDKDGDGSSRMSETNLLLRSLGLPDSVVAEVVATAKTDDSSNVSRAEFTRLCVEADKLRRAIEDDDEQQDGSLTADAAAAPQLRLTPPLTLPPRLPPPRPRPPPSSPLHPPPPPSRRSLSDLLDPGGTAPRHRSHAGSAQEGQARARALARWAPYAARCASSTMAAPPSTTAAASALCLPDERKCPYFESPRASSEAMPLKLLMECNRIHGIVDAYVATLADRPPPVSQQQSRRPARTTARGERR